MFLIDTPMCVPSQARTVGSYLHQGSTSFLKSIFMLPIQANIHFTKVFTLINGATRTLVVLYLLVISLQNEVKEILDVLTMLTKSQPSSSQHTCCLIRRILNAGHQSIQGSIHFPCTILSKHHISLTPININGLYREGWFSFCLVTYIS